MKKIILCCLLWLSANALNAQGAEMSILKFSALEMYGTTENITAKAEFIEEIPGTSVLEYYQWELRPVDGDGNAGDPVFSQGYTGNPNGVDYVFPNDVHDLLTAESDYQISLVAQDNLGNWFSASPTKFSYTQFVLTAPKMVCCNDPLIVNSTFTGPVMINQPFTHSWSVTPCDALGNSTGAPIYTSLNINGIPGTFNVTASVSLICDQYYRIDLDFLSGMQDMRPVRRSVVVLVTSYILEAATKYCAGEYVHANAKFCQGPNSTVFSLVKWELLNSDAAGTPLSVALSPPLINNSGIYTFAGSNNLPGGYYLIRLTFLTGPVPGTPIPNSQRTQLIYIGQNIQPVISGPSVITGCGNSFSVTPTGQGYSYQWSAYNGATQTSLSAAGNTATVWRGNYNTVKVIVTSPDGCVKQATKAVTNNYIYVNPAITLVTNTYSYEPNSYWINIQRTGSNSLSNVQDIYMITNITANMATGWNACWSQTQFWNSTIQLYSYNGANFPGQINTCNSLPSPTPGYPQGRFYKNNIYMLERVVTVNGCTYVAGTFYFNQNGIYSSTIRQGEEIEMEIAATSETGFNVFPNPGNVSFTVQFEEATENAQAELYSITGEKMDAFSFSGTSYTYSPAATLAPGMYLLRILNNGVQTTQRIIVE
jgi:hypothetical protein